MYYCFYQKMMIKNSNDESKKLSDGQENSKDETNVFASHVKVHTNRFVIIENSSQ